MANQAVSNLHLKESIAIPGIFEAKKYKAAETAQTDMWGSSYGALTVFNVNDVYLSKAHPLPCDPVKYSSSVQNAAASFLKQAISEFQSNFK
jgi:hypothetical protein